MRFVAAGASVRGPAHIDQNLPNQDAITLRGNRGGWIAAACDGLGSCAKSHLGSRAAASAVSDLLSAGGGSPASHVNASIHEQWLRRISPHSVSDVATTCLWATVNRDGNCLLGQLGDGLILFRSRGRFFRLTPDRQGYGNQTQALWREHKEQHWHQAECFLIQPGDGLVLMTDGVSDDLVPDALEGFFDALYLNITQRGRRSGRRWLEKELENWSTPMHGDDKSVVAIFRAD